ncbi:Transcription factor CBF/NF-Y/archaeal histone [Kalmanozyma brasiliensis GHG001]|uniref:Transcription factor CBF/NF-Y/archaeal histone n=1 Tax=Kalmanozyma brasiliensis (strain GHG001) TaxID=1365824 RepID=UPI001CEB89F4|nr:Transcription factor CBF/NF-Y/archaeal histone [Kalmanozyma brasiliensis GHG001]EST06834.2 Transcription factor CBF/NF-Y/archaeal histone [Kalmanozyma brasiliensis GHG001]
MVASTSTPTGALPFDGPTSSHSTPGSYTSSSHALHHHANATHASTPTSTTSLDPTNLSSHPTYTAMFPDPDLPIANISRIMKRSLPENAKIAKDAKECVQDCVSELISFITSEASDKCAAEKRKTINGDDILYAMRVLGFDNYEEVLRVYLSRYRMEQEANPRVKRRKRGGAAGEEEDDDESEDDEDKGQRSGMGSGFNSPSLAHQLLNPSH